jgi:hypothetical protein
MEIFEVSNYQPPQKHPQGIRIIFNDGKEALDLTAGSCGSFADSFSNCGASPM